MKNIATKLAVLAGLTLLFAVSASAQLRITEFMASNAKTLADENGSYEDWIEIFNPSTNTVELLNWSLTDSAGNPTKWRFPATNLGPSRFIVVFASNKNRRTPGAPLHTNFKLDTGGEYLALVQPNGTVASAFAPKYPGQFQDISHGFPMEALFEPLVASAAEVRVLVPVDGSLGSNWVQNGFDDSPWARGTNGVGFDMGQIDHSHDSYANVVLDGSPLAFYRLNEPGGATATNSGRLGTAGNGTYSGGATLAQSGPRPATFNGFETNNNAPRFNGTNQFLNAGQGLLTNRALFAMAGWFNAAVLSGSNLGLWGQQGVAVVGFRSATVLEFWTASGGAVSVTNTFATGTWYHVAAVGEGQRLSLYLNGALVAQGGVSVANYGTSAATFKAAGGGLFDVAGNFFNGLIDELAVYDRALTAGEVARFYQTALQPNINLARQWGVMATQSSTYANGEAHRAIDGSTDGVFANGSVSHTTVPSINNEWWEVDLGATQRIDRINLWFRTDCCAARAENLRILIYDATNVATRATLWTQNVGTAPGASRAFDVGTAVTGRVVRVEHPTGITEIISLAEVQVYQSGRSPIPSVVTDVRTAMFNSNATAFLRFPFTMTNGVEDIDQLLLRMKCDDGFVAWLNGQRVASRNAPEEPLWNSTATAAQTLRLRESDDLIDLTAFKLALLPGTNVLAIQGLNVAKDNSDFFVSARLEATYLGAVGAEARYFVTPTPGTPNGTGTADLGPYIFYQGHLPVVPADADDLVVTARISQTVNPVMSAMLHYRVMFGTESVTNMLDDGLHGDGAAGDGIFGAILPQSLSTNNQMVRWYITANDVSNRVSRWPLFPDPIGSAEYEGAVISDPTLTSKLPIFQLFVAAEYLAGIDQETGGRAAFYYDGEFYDNIYVERRGNTSAAFNKKSHRLEFNREHPLRHPGPGGRIRRTSLLAEYPDPAYIRQHLCFWLLDLMGVPSPFDYPIRAQLNGAFYQLAFHNDVIGEEQITRLGYDPDGALYKAVGNVKPDYSSTGVFQKMLPKNVADRSDYLQLANGINEASPVATRRNTVFDLLDLPEVINHLAGTRWCSENDDVWANMSLYRDTYGDGMWRLVPFDMNASWGTLYGGSNPLQATNDAQKSHPLYGGSAIAPGGGPAAPNNWNRMYDVIITLPETREMLLRRERTVLERWILQPGVPAQSLLLENYIKQMTNLIWAEAFLDRAKWNFSNWAGSNKYLTNAIDDLFLQFIGPRRVHWNATHNLTNTSWPLGITAANNAGIPPSQPANAVIQVVSLDYNPASGNQAQEYLCLTNPNSFSLDISGWQLDGAVNFTFKQGTVMPANALLYVSPSIPAFRARTTGPRGGQGLFVVGPYSGQLSARGETILVKDDTGRLASSNSYAGGPSLAQQYLRITEIMYNPPPAAGPYDAQEFEFVEFKNISTNLTLDLAGVHFTNGIDFTFTGSAVTTLGPQQTVLIVKNAAAFAFRYGAGFTNIAGQFTGALDNAGERLQLLDAANEEILDFTYNNSWYPLTDGLGFSLVVVDELAQPDAWGGKSNWRPSGASNGSPGASDPGAPALAPILVNELLTRPEFGALDAVELFNPTTKDVDMGGWFLTDDFFAPKKYRIPDGTTNLAGGYLVFTEAEFNPGGLGFSFSSQGDEVYLFSGDAAGNLTGYYHGYSFGVAETNVTFGRYVNSTGNEDFTAQLAPTLGTNNASPLVGPVVLSEIMYHPAALTTNDPPAAYLELLNITATNVPLYSLAEPTNTWRLRNAVDFDFPTNVTLPPGQALLVVGFDPATNTVALAAFRARYGVPNEAPIYGPWQGSLPNNEGVLELKKPDLAATNSVPYIMVERVHYHDSAPWPAQADGTGASLFRRHATEYGNEPTNWLAALPSPGTNYAAAQPPGIAESPQTQGMIVGTNITFTVIATGAPPLAYQWTFRGTNLPGATNATLVLTNVQLSQTGPYQVLVLNPSGTVWSDVASLLAAVQVTSPPSSQAVFPHTNVTFTVGLSGTAPFYYQWRFNGSDLPGETNATLLRPGVLPADAGSYTVLVSNLVSSALSAPGILTILTNPIITSQPRNLATMQSSNATFSVTAVSSTPLRYQWYFNTNTLLTDATNRTLLITNAQMSQVGAYSVLVSDNFGSILSAPGLLFLNLPTFITQHPQPSNVVAFVGSSVSFTSSVTGSPPFFFRWRRNGSAFTNLVTSDTSTVFSIPSVQLTNGAVYSVVVTNLVISTNLISSNAFLTVMEPLANQVVPVGTNVTFRFAACTLNPTSTSANYLLKYRWWFNETNLVFTNNAPNTSTNIFLRLTNVQPAHSGTYTVVATNNVGTVLTQSVTLAVLSPPAIAQQPTNQTVRQGASTTFSVVATGSEPLTYQWWFNGTNLLPSATNSTLILTNVQASDDGTYHIVVANPVGAIPSDTARLALQSLLVAGQMALQHFTGPAQNGFGTRTVTFKATDNGGLVLATWNLPLDFTPGLNGSGIAGYTLTNVPPGTVRLSAKTAWHLRLRQAVAFSNGEAVVDFTGPLALQGGDIDGSNLVDMGDYNQLTTAWYTTQLAADLDGSGLVDILDYFILATNWYLEGTPE